MRLQLAIARSLLWISVFGLVQRGGPAWGQIVPDATLGGEASLVDPIQFVNGGFASVIEGGAVRDANLFHSFSEFNVNDGQRVYFDSPFSIENIFSRVTGDTASNILGTLGVDGNANLFLLNPNGIFFGPNAQLDITGSFLATTASAFDFGNGDLYSAVTPELPPLLSVSITPGLQYSAIQRDLISEAALSTGQDLTLAGGTLALQGPLMAGGDVTLEAQGDAAIASIDLETTDATSNDILVRTGGDLTVTAGSTLLTNAILSDLGNPETVAAGDITLIAGGDVRLQDRVLLQARSAGAGSSGDIAVQGASLTLGNRAQIETSTRGTGAGGDIAIDVTGDVVLAGTNTRILNLVEFGAEADGGDTQITANNLAITNGAGIYNAVRGTGNSGTITLTIGDTVLIDGSDFASNSSIVNSVYAGGTGNAGDVNLQARSLQLIDGGAIVTTTQSTGNAGNVNLAVSDNILITGIAVDKTLPVSVDDPLNTTIDVFFLSDNTSSMAGIINAVREGASNLLGRIAGEDPRFVGLDINFGVGRYLVDPIQIDEDYGPLDAYTLIQPVTPDVDDALAGIDTWTADNGGFSLFEIPTVEETAFFALHQVASSGAVTDGIGSTDPGIATLQDTQWREEARQVIIWFGDEPSRQSTVEVAEAIEILNDNQVTVAAINTRNIGSGIDSGGQASEIVNATGGRLFNNVSTSNVTEVVLTAADEVIGIDFTVIDNPIGRFSELPNVLPDLDLSSSPSGIYADSDLIGDGRGGSITVDTNILQVLDRGLISGIVLGAQDGGDIDITAGTVDLAQLSQISNTSFFSGTGEGGDLTITSDRLSVREGSLITTGSVASGDSGDLTIRAAESVLVQGESRITTDTGTSNPSLAPGLTSVGAAGNLTVETRQLTIQDGEISASVGLNSSGQAGTLRVDASESIDIEAIDSGDTVGLSASTLGNAAGGEVIVNTGQLSISGGGRIESGSLGLADSGDITVNASESIRLSGRRSAERTRAATLARADRLGITVESIDDERLETLLRSGISSFSSGNGDADGGDVQVTTGNLIVENEGEITTVTLGNGSAGDVVVTAESGFVGSEGRILSRSEQLGFAGDIDLTIDGALETNGGEISASADASGGGDIAIAADTFFHRNGSLLSTSVFDSTGGGGNITIAANGFVAISDSDILANAQDGQGGNIVINTPAFLAALFDDGSAVAVGRNPGAFAQFRGNGRVDISADSAGGESGEVDLATLTTGDGLAELPADLVNPTDLIDQRCALLANPDQKNQFVITGRGGVPATPGETLADGGLLADLGPAVPEVAVTPATDTDAGAATELAAIAPTDLIQEPQAWMRAADGSIYLYAAASASAPPLPTDLSCSTPRL